MGLAKHFLVRWLGCGLGLWLSVQLFSSHITLNGQLGAVAAAGFLLALINMLLKPILVILSLPVIVLTLGLFMIIVNGLTVLIVSALYPPLQVTGFWTAVVAGIVIGLVNYLVTATLEKK